MGSITGDHDVLCRETGEVTPAFALTAASAQVNLGREVTVVSGDAALLYPVRAGKAASRSASAGVRRRVIARSMDDAPGFGIWVQPMDRTTSAQDPAAERPGAHPRGE